MPLISVIILNWNGRKFLDECLKSIEAQSFTDFEVLLVDNGSNDGSVQFVRENFPWVVLVALPENVGFAGGNNQGMKECRGEYIVLLNNDTKAAPDLLTNMVEAAESQPDIGMVAAKMLNFYRSGEIDSVGIKASLNGLGYSIGAGELDRGQFDVAAEVFGPCGGAALYKRAMIEEVGFFDPDFFAYYEDLDLSWRAQLSGWKCLSAPKAVVYHVHSATSGEWSPFKVYQTHRNKWFTIFKNWPASVLWRGILIVLLYDVAAFLLAAMRGRSVAALKARVDVLVQLPGLLRKRREILRGRRLSGSEVYTLFSSHEGFWRTFMRKISK